MLDSERIKIQSIFLKKYFGQVCKFFTKQRILCIYITGPMVFKAVMLQCPMHYNWINLFLLYALKIEIIYWIKFFFQLSYSSFDGNFSCKIPITLYIILFYCKWWRQWRNALTVKAIFWSIGIFPSNVYILV